MEILLRNIALHAKVTENNIEGSVTAEFQVNYNNIHKVYVHWDQYLLIFPVWMICSLLIYLITMVAGVVGTLYWALAISDGCD